MIPNHKDCCIFGVYIIDASYESIMVEISSITKMTDHKKSKCKCFCKTKGKCKDKGKCDCHKSVKLECKKRFFRDHSDVIRCGLGKLNFDDCDKVPKFTDQDSEYRDFHFNGSFTKSLAHDTGTGSLLDDSDYKKLAVSLANNNLQLLASIPLAFGTQIVLVNPTASFASIFSGAPQCLLFIEKPPILSSKPAAAEMVEVYSEAVARDVAFCEYATNDTIAKILDEEHLNNEDVLMYFPGQDGDPFTAQTVFRIPFHGCLIGPYVSQLLLLDIPISNFVQQQLYSTYEARYPTGPNGGRSEWGVDASEMIKIQNGQLGDLPGPIAIDDTPKYIFNGRALAEAVHGDAVFQYYYQAANLLAALGIGQNPTLPKYPNQQSFVTDGGLPTVLCGIAACAELALKHAWYWKWRVFRRLRPEVYSLWLDNVKSGLVANQDNSDLSDIILDNKILEDIKEINDTWLGNDMGGYTLPLTFMEGSPAHPSYPAGHAVVAGACITILKILLDTERNWNSLPKVISGELANGVTGVIEATASGTDLKAFDGSSTAITVATELNKLGTNISVGRNIAGVHYFTDGRNGMWLGEQIAERYMADLLSISAENYLSGEPPKIRYRDFSGRMRCIIPTVCEKKLRKPC